LDPDLVFYNKFFTIDADYELATPVETCSHFEHEFKKAIFEQLAGLDGDLTKANLKEILMKKAKEVREKGPPQDGWAANLHNKRQGSQPV